MSSPVIPPPQAEPPAPALNEAQRLGNVFFSPTKTFADLRRSAKWIAPFVVMLLLSWVYGYVIEKRVGFDVVTQNNMRMAPASQQRRIESLPPDQRAAEERQQVKITKYITYGFPGLALVWWIIVALVLWGTFSFGAGAEISFGRTLAVIIYASLVGIVKPLMAIAVIFGQDTADFLIQNPVGTNLGYYLNFADTPRFLYSLATGVDLIQLWVLALTAIGISEVARVKRGTAFGLVFGWWIVVSLVGAGLAAAFA